VIYNVSIPILLCRYMVVEEDGGRGR